MNQDQLSNKVVQLEMEVINRFKDAQILLAEAGVTFIPVANAIYNAYSNFTTRKALHQITILINGLESRLRKLELFDMDFLNSEEFTTLLYKASAKITTDLRQEKAHLFAQFLVGSVRKERRPSQSESFMVLEALDKIDYEHVDLLDRMRMKDKNGEVKEWSVENESLVKLGVSEDRFLLLCDYLSHVGLVSKLASFNVDNDGVLIMRYVYVVSQLGELLLDSLIY